MAFHIAKDYCLDNYCVQCFWKCHFNGIWALKDLKGRRDYLAMSSSFNKVSMGFGDDLQESFLQVWCPITVLHPFSENAFPTIFPTVSRSYSHHIPIIFPSFSHPWGYLPNSFQSFRSAGDFQAISIRHLRSPMAAHRIESGRGAHVQPVPDARTRLRLVVVHLGDTH